MSLLSKKPLETQDYLLYHMTAVPHAHIQGTSQGCALENRYTEHSCRVPLSMPACCTVAPNVRVSALKHSLAATSARPAQ